MHRALSVVIFLILAVSVSSPFLPFGKLHANELEDKRSTHEAVAKDIMIATQGTGSTQAGIAIRKLGGNAVDVAAAISFAIAVERPQSTGLGGGGFMLIRQANGKVVALDFREKAPQKAYEKMYQNGRSSVDGVWAVGVPGMVAGVLEALEKYGKLGKTAEGRKKILQPAIELAEKGFPVYEHLNFSINHKVKRLKEAKLFKADSAFAKTYLDKDGQPLKVSDRLVQKNLGKTLRTIAEKGQAGFYSGWVAKAIAKESDRLGGLISEQDLSNYNVRYKKPIRGSYKGYEIFSMPVPSSGGVHIVQMLNMLENADFDHKQPTSAKNVHLVASAMQLAFADRAKYLGDVPDVPVKGLTSKDYAKSLFANVEMDRARKSKKEDNKEPVTRYESDETTHFTVMDAEGNVVTSTQTINWYFGSGVVIPGTGIVMNNEMDDFVADPKKPNAFGLLGGKANSVQPGKRPLSSMTPTIVLKEGKPKLALGSPAGPKIISCVLLATLNYLEFKMPLYEAVATPRFHHQWFPDEIRTDGDFNVQTAKKLEKLGYQVTSKDLGCKVQAVAAEEGKLHGVSDPRGEGAAVGL